MVLTIKFILLIAAVMAMSMLVVFVAPQLLKTTANPMGLSRYEANKIASRVLRNEKRKSKRTFTWAC